MASNGVATCSILNTTFLCWWLIICKTTTTCILSWFFISCLHQHTLCVHWFKHAASYFKHCLRHIKFTFCSTCVCKYDWNKTSCTQYTVFINIQLCELHYMCIVYSCIVCRLEVHLVYIYLVVLFMMAFSEARVIVVCCFLVHFTLVADFILIQAASPSVVSFVSVAQTITLLVYSVLGLLTDTCFNWYNFVRLSHFSACIYSNGTCYPVCICAAGLCVWSRRFVCIYVYLM